MESSTDKGAFKYYVIKEVGEWAGQTMMFDDKVGGWEWLNDDMIKKYTRKKTFVWVRRKQGCNFLLQSQDQTQCPSSVSKLT